MGILDLFKKFNKKKDVSKPENTTDNNELKLKDCTPDSITRLISTMTSKSVCARTNGDVLERVNDEYIENGTYVIPEFVRNIDTNAFWNCQNLVEITIPKTVEHIGLATFENCKNLVTVNYLAQSPTICSWRFKDCEKLRNITLPDSIRTIGEQAFANCKSLETINIPQGCWSIYRNAFEDCSSLKSVVIPDSMALIGREAFAGCENLVITFMENTDFGQVKYGDIIDFGSEDEELEEGEYSVKFEINEDCYDALGIKYIPIEIGGKNFKFPQGSLIIEEGALDGVKEVVAYSPGIIQKAIKSGYKGLVTYEDLLNGQSITIDLAKMPKDISNGKDSQQNDDGIEYLR